MPSRQAPPTVGREAQRRRTRRAIVDAARTLLQQGGPPPTVDAIAAAADVSRRTVYMHFPTTDQLLLDAALGALSEAYVDTALDPADGSASEAGEDVRDRVAALAAAMTDLAPTALPLGREILRLTVGARPDGRTDDARVEAGAPRRGARRVGWIEAALEPVAESLTEEQHDRLVSALTMVIGFEAQVALRDIRGVSQQREAEVTQWAARALVEAMLAELD